MLCRGGFCGRRLGKSELSRKDSAFSMHGKLFRRQSMKAHLPSPGPTQTSFPTGTILQAPAYEPSLGNAVQAWVAWHCCTEVAGLCISFRVPRVAESCCGCLSFFVQAQPGQPIQPVQPVQAAQPVQPAPAPYLEQQQLTAREAHRVLEQWAR